MNVRPILAIVYITVLGCGQPPNPKLTEAQIKERDEEVLNTIIDSFYQNVDWQWSDWQYGDLIVVRSEYQFPTRIDFQATLQYVASSLEGGLRALKKQEANGEESGDENWEEDLAKVKAILDKKPGFQKDVKLIPLTTLKLEKRARISDEDQKQLLNQEARLKKGSTRAIFKLNGPAYSADGRYVVVPAQIPMETMGRARTCDTFFILEKKVKWEFVVVFMELSG